MMGKEEYLRAVEADPWGFPWPRWQTPPLEWVAEAWELPGIRDIVTGSIIRDVSKGLGLRRWDVVLRILSDSLTTEQVVGLFLAIRNAEPHREFEFRQDFVRAFRKHAHALPTPLGCPLEFAEQWADEIPDEDVNVAEASASIVEDSNCPPPTEFSERPCFNDDEIPF